MFSESDLYSSLDLFAFSIFPTQLLQQMQSSFKYFYHVYHHAKEILRKAHILHAPISQMKFLNHGPLVSPEAITELLRSAFAVCKGLSLDALNPK